jgi:hypothetical protein
MIDRLISHNDRIQTQFTRFHSRSLPSIHYRDYFQRLVHYGRFSVPSILSIIVYIDRISRENPKFIISSLTIHRFLIVALTCATKTIDDRHLSNLHYSKIGGIPMLELGILEFEFLNWIRWNVLVQHEVLQEYFLQLLLMKC